MGLGGRPVTSGSRGLVSSYLPYLLQSIYIYIYIYQYIYIYIHMIFYIHTQKTIQNIYTYVQTNKYSIYNMI